MNEQRKTQRILFRHPLKIKNAAHYISAETSDISPDGIGIISKENMVMDVPINAAFARTKFIGHIRWKKFLPDSNLYKYGVQFLNADKSVLKRMIDKVKKP